MIERDVTERLMAEARSVLRGRFSLRREADIAVVDLTHDDGSTLWPNYASGHDELVAILVAEQRYLVEEEGRGSIAGATYLDKAHERIQRAVSADGA